MESFPIVLGDSVPSVYPELSAIHDLLERGASLAPNALVATPQTRASLRELVDRADSMAAALREGGVGPGARVLLASPNGPSFLMALAAISMTGAVIVPLNERLTGSEMGYILRAADIDVALVFTDGDHRANSVVKLRAALDIEGLRLPLLSFDHTGDVSQINQGLNGRTDWAISSPTRHSTDAESGGGQEVAIIKFTSGTTAKPKGVCLTNKAVVFSAMTQAVGGYELTSRDRVWVPHPWFHSGGLQTSLATVSVGASLYTAPSFDAASAAKMIVDERMTVLHAGFETIAMRTGELLKGADLEHLRLVVTAGSAESMRATQRIWPMAVQVSIYGLTEGGAIIASTSREDDLQARLTTLGRPFAGGPRIAIADEAGNLLGPDQSGEILVSGPGLFIGYLDDQEATMRALRADGWLRTGDRGEIGQDRRLRFLGRIKDMLKVAGENVAPAEIEEVLMAHESVRHAEVVGAFDVRFGEAPVAFVELDPGHAPVDSATLTAYCAERLSRIKVPREIRFVDDWPMSATKISKKALRGQLESASQVRE